jgi:fructose-1,6-bisphosphatase/inositol monophosphatase family enzyme
VHADASYGLVSIDFNLRGGEGFADFATSFALAAIAKRRWDMRMLASTLALVYVATGRLAAAVYGWDGLALHVGAGVLLAKEAGATVSDHTGADWSIGSRTLVVAATDALHGELQTLAAEVYAQVTSG